MVRLVASDEEKALLLKTMKQYNSAANFVSAKAFEFKLTSKYLLQKLVYHEIRLRFKLSAQLAIRVISKVTEAYKRNRNIKPVFRELGAIQYDQRNLSWKGLDRVSIMTLNGRLKLQTRIGEYQRARGGKLRGQADLICKQHLFYLVQVVEVREETPIEPKGTIGVDLGIENIATDSEGHAFSGQKVEMVRQKFNKRRRILQKVNTKNSKRALKKLSGKEARFKRDVNHVISKIIVSKAKGTTRAIALEDLSGIRARATVRHDQRDRHNKWSFRQLRSFIAYKAKREGVPLMMVDPKNTSRECPKCHYIDKRNRPTRNQFKCIRCAYGAMADHIAAINIAARVRVNEPMAVPVFTATANPGT